MQLFWGRGVSHQLDYIHTKTSVTRVRTVILLLLIGRQSCFYIRCLGFFVAVVLGLVAEWPEAGPRLSVYLLSTLCGKDRSPMGAVQTGSMG